MELDFTHPRTELVRTMARIYNYRMTTTSGGNLSLVDEDNTLWITPSQVDKGGLQERDIVAIPSGGKAEGIHPPSSEYPFHRQIYEARPDIRAIVHAHPVALVAFSVVRQIPDVRAYAKALGRCGKLAMAPYALPGSEELGANIAQVFREGADVAILENHGVVIGGRTLSETFARFELLEFFCRSLIQASRIGQLTTLSDSDETALRSRPEELPVMDSYTCPTAEKELRTTLSRFIRRGYEQGLFTGIQGTFSARLGEDRFVITPKEADRREIRKEELCTVDQGCVQPGRKASLAARAHREIYRRQPEVAAIINAASPAALAFAMTGTSLDARTIPESYIFLNEVPRLSFQEVYSDPEGVAAKAGLSHPVHLVQNDGILVVARSIFECFDRLEVAEATAQSLVESSALGTVCPMGDEAIQDLRKAFRM